MKSLLEVTKRPPLYAKGTLSLWRDSHISKGMLEAHLDTSFEGASRTDEFMDNTVSFISEKFPAKTHKRLLDLGCGPGLYAHRFKEKGYTVTGVDFAARSIDYAKNKYPDIEFLCQDYLMLEREENFDIVVLIFCDFGVLPPNDRADLLERIYKALKPGGKLIMDVFTRENFTQKDETHTWDRFDEGFFKADPHVVLESFYQYEEGIFCNRHIIIDEDGHVDSIFDWHQSYSKESFKKELSKYGFNTEAFYGSARGEAYTASSHTLCGVFSKR